MQIIWHSSQFQAYFDHVFNCIMLCARIYHDQLNGQELNVHIVYRDVEAIMLKAVLVVTQFLLGWVFRGPNRLYGFPCIGCCPTIPLHCRENVAPEGFQFGVMTTTRPFRAGGGSQIGLFLDLLLQNIFDQDVILLCFRVIELVGRFSLPKHFHV